MKSRRGFWIWFFITIVVVVVIDQASKYFVLQNLEPGMSRSVFSGFFNLTLTFNRGAAFGLLADFDDGIRRTLLSLATLIAIAVVFYFLFIEYAGHKLAQTALAMILGGAIGNIIDRARMGMVVDFLDVYVGEYHWPAFNAADSFICVGVAILLFCSSRKKSTGDAIVSNPN